MTLDELLRTCGLPELGGESPSIESVTCDSRRVVPGSLFVVIEGVQENGAAYVDDAVARGAVAVAGRERVVERKPLPFVLLERPRLNYAQLCAAHFEHPALSLDVIGVTGTNGKTTSTMMLEQLLATVGRRPGLIGTVRNVIGQREERATMTTPGAEDLNRLLADMRDAGLDSVALEVSSHALDQSRLAGNPLAVAAFTNMARDHLDYHGTVEAYHEAKFRLLDCLAEDGCAVLNADAPETTRLMEKLGGGRRVLRYTLTGQPAEVSGAITSMDLSAMKLEIDIEGEKITCETRVIGVHNAANILLVCTAAHALGIPATDIARGIENLEQIVGRCEVLDVSQDFDVLVDYAHSPDAFESMLGTLRALTKNRLHVLFGCGGDRDQGKRPLMGQIAEILADTVVLTDDNPRSENPDKIVMDIKAGMNEPERVSYIANRREAVLHILDMAEPNDVVLLAGKGHEQVQIIGDEVQDYDDHKVAAEWGAWRDGSQGYAP